MLHAHLKDVTTDVITVDVETHRRILFTQVWPYFSQYIIKIIYVTLMIEIAIEKKVAFIRRLKLHLFEGRKSVCYSLLWHLMWNVQDVLHVEMCLEDQFIHVVRDYGQVRSQYRKQLS